MSEPQETACLDADVLRALVAGSDKLVVEFGPQIEDLECYPEPGMRAHIVTAERIDDDVFTVLVSYADFEDLNRGLETANYWDANGSPTLTAREAGKYRQEERLPLPGFGDLAPFLTVADDALMRRLAAYRASGAKSYFAWLEEIADAHLAEEGS